MNIFITAAWTNHKIVAQISNSLTANGHEVKSFLNAPYIAEGEGFKTLRAWKESASSRKAFKFEFDAATKSDLVIYVGQGDRTAWALVGLAAGAGVPVYGIADGREDVVTMRDLVRWFDGADLIAGVQKFANRKRLTARRKPNKVRA